MTDKPKIIKGVYNKDGLGKISNLRREHQAGLQGASKLKMSNIQQTPIGQKGLQGLASLKPQLPKAGSSNNGGNKDNK